MQTIVGGDTQVGFHTSFSHALILENILVRTVRSLVTRRHRNVSQVKLDDIASQTKIQWRPITNGYTHEAYFRNRISEKGK